MKIIYTIVMIIAKNTVTIPDHFKLCGGGFANQVFKDEQNNIILKIYSKNEYYVSELNAFSSGFQYMPKLLENGVIGKKNYIVMTFIGGSISEFTDIHCMALVETMVALHAHKNTKQSPSFEQKFHLLQEHGSIISDIFHIDIESLFSRLNSYVNKGSVFSLVHGDITLSNLRNVSEKIFLIDFDETSYFVPEFDIAKLYWSDIKLLQDINGIGKFISTYNRFSKHKISIESSMHDWVLFAGVDFWLWRYLNLQNQPALIQEARERLVAYKKHQYETQ